MSMLLFGCCLRVDTGECWRCRGAAERLTRNITVAVVGRYGIPVVKKSIRYWCYGATCYQYLPHAVKILDSAIFLVIGDVTACCNDFCGMCHLFIPPGVNGSNCVVTLLRCPFHLDLLK